MQSKVESSPEGQSDLDDLAQHHDLTEENILEFSRRRFQMDLTHVFVAETLWVFNPYRRLRECEEEPHERVLALKLYSQMKQTGQDQRILISGESGSGKSELAKRFIRYLTLIAAPEDKGPQDLAMRIAEVDPILEAFGNAATSLNPQSSRFAKFIELKFTNSGCLSGAGIVDFMLEKNRVVEQMEGERNFHIFYSMFIGMTPEQLKTYRLSDPNKHRSLRRSSDIERPEHKNYLEKLFQDVQTAFVDIGLDDEEFDQVFRCLAAILFITDVTFAPDCNSLADHSDRLVHVDDHLMYAISDLLRLDKERLSEAFIMSSQVTRGEKIFSMHSESKAMETRNSLARVLYSRMFGWIILRLNNFLQETSAKQGLAVSKTIGILDFSGFEITYCNGFDQLCINMTNEKLQHFFMQRACMEEQELYMEEGIVWKPIEMPQCEDRFRMFFAKPNGLLELLDNASREPFFTDEEFVKTLAVHLGECPSFSQYLKVDRMSMTKFCIKHYAGEVTYDAKGFLVSNRNTLSSDLCDVMVASLDPFFADLFSAQLPDTGCLSRTRSTIRTNSRKIKQAKAQGKQRIPEKYQQPSIATLFRISMQKMLTKLTTGDLYFARCIKPNAQQRPKIFDDETVLRQFRYSGILQLAEMRSLGFPHHLTYDNFAKRYRVLFPSKSPAHDDIKNLSKEIINSFSESEDDVKFGTTKVFMKPVILERLNTLMKHTFVCTLQRNIRRFLAAKQRKNQQSKKKVSVQSDIFDTPTSTEHRDSVVCMPVSIPEEPTKRATAKKVGFKLPQFEDEVTQQEPKILTKEVEYMSTGQTTKSVLQDTDESSDDEVPVMDNQPWDIPASIDIEPLSAEESFRGVMTFLRLMMHILLFLIVLASATASQLSILGLTAALGINSKASNITIPHHNFQELEPSAKDARWKVAALQLLVILCVPKILTIIICFLKSFFGHVPSPPASIFILAILMETFQAFGEMLLVVRVLPQFGSTMSLCMMFSVGVIPAFFKLIFWVSQRPKYSIDRIKLLDSPGSEETTTGSSRVKSGCFSVLDMTLTSLSFTLQAGGLAFPIVVMFYHWNQFWVIGGTGEVYHFTMEKHLFWEVPVAVLLTSLRWWENFVHRDRGCLRLVKIKRQLFGSRQKFAPVVSLWGIFVCVVSFYIMELLVYKNISFQGDIRDFLVGNDTYYFSNEHEKALFVPCIVQVLSSLICYCSCVLASKLLMQTVSYVCALYLSIPASAAIVILQCQFSALNLPAMLKCYTWLCDYHCESSACKDGLPSWAVVSVASLWILSLLYITSYVWNNNTEKLAMVVRLFVTPLYSGPLLVPSMFLNRRSLDKEIKVAGNGVDLEFRDLDSPSFLDEDGRRKKAEDEEENTIPVVYACATLWHETKQEMKQLLKSIFRMDMDQCARKIALNKFGLGESDYYKFETHCFFDDAWEQDKSKKGVFVPNKWVMTMLSVINEAASVIYETEVELPPPVKTPTPYGGQLVWKLPGGNKMIIHLKDKQKIRHKKRWSQVMYMYYLLGWKLLGNDTSKIVSDSLNSNQAVHKRKGPHEFDSNAGEPRNLSRKLISKFKDEKGKDMAEGSYTTGLTFQEIEKKVLVKAENTFLLALDGDVDFRPEAVVMLIDRLKRNPKTGGACGRIHPIGSGPVVWYQIFEYAIGHWMQKATEHVLGSVLCSPGCFSLFRGSTLMDTNIMCRYTTKATEASHFLQYDQGEDRWLCTLIVQQGYRIDYCAGADALTYAPETFNEFYNQRRRWVTSTLANILDLLSSYKTTVYINDNISTFYMFYQVVVTLVTILGPATIVIAIAGSLRDILMIHEGWAYTITVLPSGIFIGMTFLCEEKIQLLAAAFLSLLYAAAMVVVPIGILKAMVLEGFMAPSAVFVAGIALCFIFGGILHPYEFGCLASGMIYFLCIPSGYLVLMIYSLGNMHLISWGTRETPKPLEENSIKVSIKKDKEEPKSFASSFLRLDKYYKDFKQTIMQTMKDTDDSLQRQQLELLRELNETIKKAVGHDQDGVTERDVEESPGQPAPPVPPPCQPGTSDQAQPTKESDSEKFEHFEEDPLRPEWAVHVLSEGDMAYLSDDEVQFWENVIQKYVKPLKSIKKAEELKEKLSSLRNNVSFGFWFLNGMWIILNCMIESAIPPLKIGPFTTPPLGFIFLSLCFLLMILQLIGMVIHRWETFLQLIANTVLPWGDRSHKSFKKEAVDEAVRVTKMIQQQRFYKDNVEVNLTYIGKRPKGERISSFLTNFQSSRFSRHSVMSKLKESHKVRAGPDPAFNTVSRGVAATLKRQLGLGSTVQGHQYLQPDELERRFERRLSRLMDDDSF